MTEQAFRLGRYPVDLVLDSSRLSSGSVGALSLKCRYRGWADVRSELKNRRSVAIDIGGTVGRVEYPIGRRRLRVSYGGRTWNGQIRRRGGIKLADENGNVIAILTPWRMSLEATAAEIDAAVALQIVLLNLDVQLGPAWVLFLSALGFPIGWPKPFPRRGWGR